MASTDARPVPKKNVAYRVYLPIYDADGDLVTGAAGLDSEVSKDGGNYADCTNEATEIQSTGTYFLDLTSTEMDADCVVVIVKTSTVGAKTTPIFLYPEEAGDIRVDVTQLGGDSQSATDLKDFADAGYDPATNKVEGVKLADTLTTYTGNTPQTGDAFARLGAPVGASISADVAGVKGDTVDIEADTQDIQSKIGTPAGASIAADIAAVEAQTDDIGAAGAGLTAITDKTNLIPANPAAVGSAMTLTSGERDSIATALLDLANGVETSQTVRKALRAMAATLAGDVAGGPGSPVHKSLGGSTDRVSSSADADGNRTVVLTT